MKRYNIDVKFTDWDIAEIEEIIDPKGSWIKWDDLEKIISHSTVFALVHIEDGDELGERARELYKILKG